MSKKIKVLNKHLMMLWNCGGSPEIVANIFETCKAYCLAKARNPSWELPYRLGFLDWGLQESYPQLFQWYEAFTNDNPPGKVRFDNRLQGLIEDIDFSKPFDPSIADSIRRQFTAEIKRIEVDSDNIVQNEFEE